MELALICAQQVIVLFLLIGVGTLAVKTGVLKLEHKQPLSNLLVNIVVPAMIVNSYQMEFSLEILRNLLAAFGLSILTIALGTVLTLARPPQEQPDRDLPLRQHLFQCSLHGLPAHLGPVRLGGAALRQRLCHGVQRPALDAGLQHGQRQL
jgi:hypothetical protein